MDEGSIRAWTFMSGKGFIPCRTWRMPGDDPTSEAAVKGGVFHTHDVLRMNGFSTTPCMGLGDTGDSGIIAWVYPKEDGDPKGPLHYVVNVQMPTVIETVICPSFPDSRRLPEGDNADHGHGGHHRGARRGRRGERR